MPTQRTLIIFKPDCVQRRLVGPILQRFEAKGLRLVGLKLLQAGRELAERHYAVHKGKPFYESLLGFLTSGPTVAAHTPPSFFSSLTGPGASIQSPRSVTSDALGA